MCVETPNFHFIDLIRKTDYNATITIMFSSIDFHAHVRLCGALHKLKTQ